MKHLMIAAAACWRCWRPWRRLPSSWARKTWPITNLPKMRGIFWAPKPTTPTPYTAPNKPHWKLSEILAAHKGQSDWVQPIVRNKDQEGDYISMGAGKKTKQQMYPDDRVVFIVWDGSIKVSIDGYAAFTATKGFMVNVPFRHMYTLENVGSTPALRFEVRQDGSVPIYPASETPDPVKGMTYTKVTEQPGPAKEKDSNPIYVDYMKEFNGTDKAYGGKFVWDDHFTSNILRGKGAPVPADNTNQGPFPCRLDRVLVHHGRPYRHEGRRREVFRLRSG